MGTANTFNTDLYSLNSYVQNTMISHPKSLFIEALRDFFSQDSYYHYQRDAWGFPLTPDHTDLPTTSGLEDDSTTRLFIGEAYRKDIIYYPALLVKHGGARSVPISMNRETGSVQWGATKVVDGYGNERIFSTPSHFIQAGAWQGSIAVDIKTKSLRARDELAELVSILFVNQRFDEMKNSGVVILGTNISSPTETEDRNDKIYVVTVNFDIRTEWRRHIPIETVIDAINFCIDFGQITSTGQNVAPNLTINTTVELMENLLDL